MSTLYVMEGDYGLASLDVASLESILYAKLNRIPCEIKTLNSIKSCSLYSAPSLRTEADTIVGFSNILSHWKTSHGNLDDSLTSRESSETLALNNLVSMKLKPVLVFTYWVDQRNCEELINRWYMRALPLPFNYLYTKKKKSQAAQLFEALYPLDTDLEVIKDFITKAATECLSTLSTRLGKSNFFYGDSPKTLDIIVYSHIAPLIKLPFPTNDPTALMTLWPNLSEFVKRIDAKYLPDVKHEVKYLKSETTIRQSDDEVSYMAVFILFVSATSLVVGFALKQGFVKISKF